MFKIIPLLFLFIFASCGDNANVGINPNQPTLKPSSLALPSSADALDDALSVEQGSSSAINVLINDVIKDIDNESLVITKEINADCSIVNGEVSINTATSTVGAASCEYQICNKDKVCDQANININIYSPASPDLLLTKKVDKSSAIVGDNVVFTLTVKNNGPTNATGVSVTDILPNTLQFISSSSSAYNQTTGVWTIGSLSSGASVSLTITTQILASASGSLITNTATNLHCDQGDANSSADTPSATVSVGSLSPDLQVTKELGTAELIFPTGSEDPDYTYATAGTNISYKITIKNNGPVNATLVSLTDKLPSTLEFISSNSSKGSYSAVSGIWNIGSLGNGESATLTLTAKIIVSASINGATIINTVTNVTSQNGDSNLSADDLIESVRIETLAPALILNKTVSNPNPQLVYSPAVPTPFFYTITVRNLSQVETTGVKVTDLLPSGIVYQSSSASHGSYNNTTGLWSIGTLNSNETASLQINVTLNSSPVFWASHIFRITNWVTNPTSEQGNNNLYQTASATINVVP